MIWKNRIRVKPFLRKLTHKDGTEEEIEIEDIETNISQNGTPLNEENLNIQEKNIGTYGDDTYSNARTYSINDIVTYQGLLYKCIEDITVAEEFNNSHWQRFSLLDKIKSNEINIATNAADIAINTANITVNTSNIETNAENIATNATNIANNTSAIENLEINKISKEEIVTVKEGINLNDYIETGIYYFPYDTSYTPLNIPAGVNGWLVVIKGTGTNLVKQIWYRHGTNNTNDYETYVRTMIGGTWSSWRYYKMGGTVLYNNATGSNGTITLSETAANFTYIKIFYRTNNNAYFSTEVYSPNGKVVGLMGYWINNTVPRAYLKPTIVKINGISITNNADTQYGEIKMNASGTYNSISKSNNAYIVRVEGFKN